MKKKAMMFSSLCVISLFTSLTFAQALVARKGPPRVKVGLNSYSFAGMLLDGLKDGGKGTNLFAVLDFCAENNIDGVDLTGYFFPGYPNAPTDEYINNIKRRAFELGVDITGTGVKNDFADPDPAKRAADVVLVKRWIDVAQKLGAPVIRVFAGPPPAGYDDKRAEVAKYMAASLRECAEYGQQKGVLVGVQNHGDFLQTADQCIEMVKMVNSPWFGLIVDTGKFLTKDPYADIEKAIPYAVNFQIKESPFGQQSPIKTDLKRLMQIVKKSGYRGYLPVETLDTNGSPGAKIPYNPFATVPLFLKEVKAAMDEVY